MFGLLDPNITTSCLGRSTQIKQIPSTLNPKQMMPKLQYSKRMVLFSPNKNLYLMMLVIEIGGLIDISMYSTNTTIFSNEEPSRTHAIMGSRFGLIDPNLEFMTANIINFSHSPKC